MIANKVYRNYKSKIKNCDIRNLRREFLVEGTVSSKELYMYVCVCCLPARGQVQGFWRGSIDSMLLVRRLRKQKHSVENFFCCFLGFWEASERLILDKQKKITNNCKHKQTTRNWKRDFVLWQKSERRLKGNLSGTQNLKIALLCNWIFVKLYNLSWIAVFCLRYNFICYLLFLLID